MSEYILQDDEGNDWQFETIEEAFKEANKVMREVMYECGGWPEDIEVKFKVVKVVGVPKMINKRELSEMDEQELNRSKCEGWDYICEYEMQDIAQTNDEKKNK